MVRVWYGVFFCFVLSGGLRLCFGVGVLVDRCVGFFLDGIF